MQKNNGDMSFWRIRSEKYNNLDWANHDYYLKEIVKELKPREKDVVLDVGTGTGIIAHAIKPFVREVIGLDKSQDMLDHSNWQGNLYFIKRDIRQPIFAEKTFDKVTARQVFHHILTDTQAAMDQCYKALKPGGKFLVSEGVPPSGRTKKDYVNIFKLKEKRLTFMPEDLKSLMVNSGFKNIREKIIYLEKMSVRNWLSNSGLSKAKQEKIYSLHKKAGDYFKKDYRMIETKNDCLINMKMLILTGEK